MASQEASSIIIASYEGKEHITYVVYNGNIKK